MRADIIPGAAFPDYELTDHTAKRRKPAPADVPRHGAIDIVIRRLLIARQQSRRLHDLPRLAITALRHIGRHPCLLQRMRTVRAEPFDSDNGLRPHLAHFRRAGPNRVAVHMYRARSAQADTAAELSPCHAQFVAQIPKQGHFLIAVESAIPVINSKSDLGGNLIRIVPFLTGWSTGCA